MMRFWAFTGSLLFFFLAIFLLVEMFNVPLLTNAELIFRRSNSSAAGLGILLLILDVFIPVPSSLIMIGFGAMFGLLKGAALSFVGTTCAGILGFIFGRWGGKIYEKFVSEAERINANKLMKKWGSMAILISRPIPLVAETVSIMAGVSSMKWRNFILFSILGNLPSCFVYAWTGATAQNLNSGMIAFLFVLLVACLFWLIGIQLNSPAKSMT